MIVTFSVYRLIVNPLVQSLMQGTPALFVGQVLAEAEALCLF